MEKKIVQKYMYVAFDGCEFEEEEECLKYEEFAKNLKYFIIKHGTDFTEGRYWLKEKGAVIVAIKGITEEEAVRLISWHCYNTYGSEYNFVMNVFSPRDMLPAWEFECVSLEDIENIPLLGIFTEEGYNRIKGNRVYYPGLLASFDK